MASLAVHGVHKRYGPVRALAGVELDVPSGALTAVLGPSGCGKTTLLRCVAGFERVDRGDIEVGGRPVAGSGRHLAPERRRVAVVPQEGALFPHLSVADNVGYGLGRAARRSGRVAEVLALVGLDGYRDRMPHELSGGQQQRVAVARALAPRPPLVLLDEPFSALDAGLRADVRRDVREALRADGATAVLVTHDQGEALSMADQVAVMREGRIVQSGTPADVYGEPADAWVADFVGEAVLLPATVRRGVAYTCLGELMLAGAPVPGDGAATVLIRPEQVAVAANADADADADADQVGATVVRRDFFGHDALLALRLDSDGVEVAARVFDVTAHALAPGERVGLRIRGPVLAFPASSPGHPAASVAPGASEAASVAPGASETASEVPGTSGGSGAPAVAGLAGHL